MADSKTNKKRSLPRLLVLAAVLGLAWLANEQGWIGEIAATGGADQPAGTKAPAATAAAELERVATAFRERTSGFMTEVEGRIVAVLADDNEGSRHQRFLIDLANGITLKVSHNIDLAPRVPAAKGDRLTVRGQYEWNDKGGVLHWTHHDPDGRHDEGWIRHEGRIYQ